MNRTIRRLAAAAAAASALALVPLAAASPSAAPARAATSAASSWGLSSGWGGYVATAPKGSTISEVSATFKVPTALPKNSIGGPVPYGAAMWVGMDGYSKPGYMGVEQAGLWEGAWGKKSAPTYTLFWEMYPAPPHFLWGIKVKPGDTVQVIIFAPGEEANTPNDGKFHLWLGVNGAAVNIAASIAKGATNTRHTAEVITETPSHAGSLDMGTIHYTYADYQLRSKASPKPEGPYAVTQTRVYMVYPFSPARWASIIPSRSSATDPKHDPGLHDAFTTNFYHAGW